MSLWFAKKDQNDSHGLATRLEIKYPAEAFVAQFWRNSREFHVGLSETIANFPVDSEREGVDPSTMVSGKDHSEWATLDYMARTGTQASIDFYHVKPSSVTKYTKRQQPLFQPEPQVTVLLTAAELLRLLNACEPVARECEPFASAVLERPSGE